MHCTFATVRKLYFILGIFLIACYGFTASKGKKSPLSFVGAPKNQAQLGEMLFFEPNLSLDSSISCASCHQPQHAFADTLPFSRGVNGRLGLRNAPSCMNLVDRPELFYDGRARSLEHQVAFPIQDHNEMDLPIEQAVARLNKHPKYIAYFNTIYHSKPTQALLEGAIASFERTLETSKTPLDRYINDDSLAFDASAVRGRELFMSAKAKCFDCHFSPDFTGDEYRNIGIFNGKEYNDSGRYKITKVAADIGKFRVPGLRNVAVTAPYMHNGMFKTLKEVIDYYDDPKKVIPNGLNTDTLLLQPLHLTAQEKVDLEHFLHMLTDDRFVAKATLKKSVKPIKGIKKDAR